MSHELATQAQASTPMEMIQVALDAAIKQGSAMDVVNAILEQQKWMIRHNEEEQFNAALKRIQMRLRSIPKRGWNPHTKSKFATAEDIDREIQHLLDSEGMALSFQPSDTDRQDEVRIIGLLSLGAYTREYPLTMPADGKGPKGDGVMSRTHATGAAITYGKRYLKNMIFDLRFDEKDDDGNGASVRIPSEKMNEWLSSFAQAQDFTELKKAFSGAYTTANELRDQRSLDELIAAYEQRKKEIAE